MILRYVIGAAQAAPVSRNAKLGDVAATYVSQATCPPTCPLLGKGCYAETGYVGIQAKRLDRRAEGVRLSQIARDEAACIDRLPADRPLRLHVVGDCPSAYAAQVVGEAAARYRYRGGGPVWTYTHAWKRIVRTFWGAGVSVLASCESIPGALAALGRGYAPALVVPKHQSARASVVSGLRLIPCPEQTGRARSCSDCRLCWDDGALRARRAVITFEAHGSRKGLVERACS